ncbi:MAG: hypothetical protein F7B17_00160 [Desulfurococcales archaeon]|nr:hypothetical protein [Desulfurococcales archaeon]
MASLRDDFEAKSGYWDWRIDGYASINVEDSVARLCTGPSEALYYSNAEVSDGGFGGLRWRWARARFRARMTGLHYGSAGVGLWNYTMVVKDSVPVWFIYLRARGRYPLQGVFLQAGRRFVPVKLFSSVTLYYFLKILPPLAPIRILSRRPLAQDLDPTEWHVYEVELRGGEAVFRLDGEELARVRVPEARRWRFRVDAWIDNAVYQPGRMDAGAVYRHVTQEVRERACLELDWVEVEGEG